MSKHKKQSHVVWKYDYHIVWTPGYGFRVLSDLVKDLQDRPLGLRRGGVVLWIGQDIEKILTQNSFFTTVPAILTPSIF